MLASSFLWSTVSGSVAMSAEGTGIRALWVVTLAFLALAALDRMKPATPKRPVPVRVEHTPTPLYKEPSQQDRGRAAATLSGVAVVTGAVIACLLGFLLVLGLEVVGGLLRS